LTVGNHPSGVTELETLAEGVSSFLALFIVHAFAAVGAEAPLEWKFFRILLAGAVGIGPAATHGTAALPHLHLADKVPA